MLACTLCGFSSVPKIVEQNRSFCCAGCHAVYNILSVQNQLADFANHPVFLQAVQAGLISNPALLEEIRKEQIRVPEDERVKLHLEIDGLFCPSCAEIIRLFLLREKGVLNTVVDYSTDLASIEFSPRYIDKEDIFSIISSLGYEAKPLQEGTKKVGWLLWLRFSVAAFFALNTMMLAYPLYATYFDASATEFGYLFAKVSAILSIPVITWCAFPIWQRLFNALRVGIVGMELLVFLGVFSALSLSLYELGRGSSHVYFDSMTVIIAFFLMGKIVEAKAKYSARDALLTLARSIPRKGKKKFADGSQSYVLAKDFAKGDFCAVNMGEKIVLDGKIVEGEGAVDESVLTGESFPKLKKKGDMVLGGTVVQSGAFVFRVEATEQQTALHRILETVEQQIGHKTSYVRAADKIVKVFVPSVLVLAAGVWLFGDAPLSAISVLLISCPCALGIAAPLAESNTISRLAQAGAIVRNRGALVPLANATLWVFDKTGTLTEGRLCVGLDHLSDKQRSLLKGLASRSNHPISVALAQAINEPAAPLAPVVESPGLGLAGGGCFLGSGRWMRQQGIEPPEGKFFFYDGHTVNAIELSDTVRSEAAEALSCFPKKLLLSGDGKEEVERVGKEVGIDLVQWEATPLEKREKILDLKKTGECLAMVGDGINDAPALASADVGISVVSAQDISIQASDILLTTERLTVLKKICTIAKRGQVVVRQNLFWAFIYNVLGIPLAAFGYLSPIYAAFAMMASSIIVILNGRRS